MSECEFVAALWRLKGEAARHFVTLPHEVTDDIDETHEGSRAGVGSRRIEVTVGQTTWCTSVCPDKNAASYLLPMKQVVRKAEGLVEGTAVELRLQLVVE